MVTITLLQRDTDSSSWADPFTILQYYEECQIQSAKCSALPHCKNGLNKPISPTWMWVSSFLPCLSLVIRTYQGLTNLNNWKRGNLEGSLILSWCTHSHGRDKTFADWFCHSPWIVELCSAEVFLFFPRDNFKSQLLPTNAFGILSLSSCCSSSRCRGTALFHFKATWQTLSSSLVYDNEKVMNGLFLE